MNDFIFIYLLVIISAYILGGMAQKNGKFHALPFCFSYIIPWSLICFSNNGPDYDAYLELVDTLDWDNFSSSYISEPGFNLVIVCLKEISFNNHHLTLWLLKSLNITLFALSVYYLRDRINIRLSNLFFAVFYFLPAYYLLSMYVAIGLVLCSISLYIKNKNMKVSMLLVILAAQIHNSAYLLIPIFALAYSNYALKFANRPMIKYGLLIGAFSLVSASTYIFSIALSYFSVFSHFAGYTGEGGSGSGLYVFLMYIIQFAIVFDIQKKNSSKEIVDNLFLFTLFDFIFVLSSFQFRAIERMNFYFLSSYLLFYPILFYKDNYKISPPAKSLLLFYTLIQSYFVYDARTSALGMESFHFFNPF